MARSVSLYVTTGVSVDSERLVDGRQSETALLVARGARRLLRGLGYATVVEMPLPSGRRADLMALGPDGELLVVEIKSSLADFRADHKWRDYRAHCDRLFFAIPETLDPAIMPEDAGLIVADAWGAAALREAPLHKLAPATRRALTLRFAALAADRLHALVDPGLALPE
ncbi:MAG: MmcB family DNA repair protein [Rhizobiales bacterium]|nr:MmcB family DNA repair protein [Hyphomicrobiales bacterium]